MCSASRLAILAALIATAPAASGAPPKELRVCADPNNLPFSNKAGEGFENAIAKLVARDLGRTVAYTWFPQRRGFFKNTLKANKCDVVIGVPSDLDMVATTTPYYRSSYVIVTKDRAISSLDDKRLAAMKIGVHAIGDDYANVPPAQALARRGLVDHLVGYSIYGDYSQPDPPAALIDAVQHGDIDAAIAWGPLAGYFARRDKLRMSPIVSDEPGMTFAISMGVRKDDKELRAALDRVLERRSRDIAKLLDRWSVPRVKEASR